MPTQKSQDELAHESHLTHERLNFFSQHNGSIQALDSENQHRPLNPENYNNTPTNLRQDHHHLEGLNQPNQSELDYYEEYRKIYVISYHLYMQKNKQVDLRNQLEKRIKNVQDKLRDLQKQQAPKKDTSEQNRIKRSRRTAEEIQRRYRCNVEFCERCYGSEGSLQQHIKLKHPELYKRYEANEYEFADF